jgi:biotin synthase
MSEEEILECAQAAHKLGYGTVVLQSGEDKKLDIGFLAGVIRKIKQNTDLAVTLSVGEWSRETYQLWKQAGADRYLLRFETSDDKLYRRLHPDSKSGVAGRLEKLEILRELGYEIGSGVMIGIPGQSYKSLADDLLKFKELDLDMIGTGPYIRHHSTELDRNIRTFLLDSENQVPATEKMTYKVLALTRILCPLANIPATTALATLNYETGYEKALARGCNVVMPNITPTKYRRFYNLYQGKNSYKHLNFDRKIKQRFERISRIVSNGSGVSLNFLKKQG